MAVITLVGYFALTVAALKLLRFACYLLRAYFLTRIGFRKTLKDYGEWAVVTGATDGIGKEYAKQLAENGLNIVLISRTKEKLEKVAKEIESVYSVKTKIIVFDFSKQNGYEVIEVELNELDIGLLINNVGMAYGNSIPFHTCDIQRTCNIINTNVISDVRLTHLVLKTMVSRGRGAIVHVSSGSIYFDIPYSNVYMATKIFMQKYVRSLQFETVSVIDHQLVLPMYVESNMSKVKSRFGVPTAKRYVQSAIRTIGVVNETRGYLSHELIYVFINIFSTIANYAFQKIRSRRLKQS